MYSHVKVHFIPTLLSFSPTPDFFETLPTHHHTQQEGVTQSSLDFLAWQTLVSAPAALQCPPGVSCKCGLPGGSSLHRVATVLTLSCFVPLVKVLSPTGCFTATSGVSIHRGRGCLRSRLSSAGVRTRLLSFRYCHSF